MTESLRECDPELRQVLMGNVVLTGGGSLFSGFAERLNTELSRSFPHVSVNPPLYFAQSLHTFNGTWLFDT